MNVETNENSMRWMHTHSPYKQETFKQMLSASQKDDYNCFAGQDREEFLKLQFMQQGMTVISEVYCETQKRTT
jgi:hypothetical protein